MINIRNLWVMRTGFRLCDQFSGVYAEYIGVEEKLWQEFAFLLQCVIFQRFIFLDVDSCTQDQEFTYQQGIYIFQYIKIRPTC
ncbi:hypothetical protein SS50377_20715 [Spironucleus salmonicida]|uniref:Uncharacterized protein n=1 Tax=Spironucleus salmonicida TaxID=348837 RepID=A0A9P8M0I3_9EUKA|nr:hypothetical protein SS50377_20715 [Spironucleus salmonicida]